MFNVAMLAPILQALMTTRADELAKEARFIQRRRGLTGADFLQALAFGFLKRRAAPLEDLAQPLGISRQALHQRLDRPSAPDFFKRALLEAVSHVLDAQPALCPLLAPFQGVFLDDCTQAWLPDEAEPDFPAGCGGTDKAKARMKLLVRWEIQRGLVRHVGIHEGSASDHDTEGQAPPLPKGALHLADLGFCDFGRLRDEDEQGIYWVTRLPAQTRFYPKEGLDLPLAEQLSAWREQGLKAQDVEGGVGNEERVQGRLVCLACPEDVAARRLLNLEKDANKRKRPVSARQREMCRWTVLFTNVPGGWLNALQLWMVYRLRWQIELLFRRFKSGGGPEREQQRQAVPGGVGVVPEAAGAGDPQLDAAAARRAFVRRELRAGGPGDSRPDAEVAGGAGLGPRAGAGSGQASGRVGQGPRPDRPEETQDHRPHPRPDPRPVCSPQLA
jgi:DDE family transposase